MLQAEDEVKKISLYLWIAYKLPELFPDAEVAEAARSRVNHFCQNSLKSKKLMIEEKPRRERNYKDRDKDRSRRRNCRRHR
jgi:ATP-dependent RNA helicase SUPV3L1/SUV3